MATEYSDLYRRRWSSAEDRDFVRRLLPSQGIRSECCRRLAASIQIAHDVNPARWGVTLLPGAIRVNVGPAEAAFLAADGLRLMLDAATVTEDGASGVVDRLDSTEPADFASVPNSIYVSIPIDNLAELRRIITKLKHAHEVHLRTSAARGFNGATRKGHHPALVGQIAHEAVTDLPQPSYMKVIGPSDAPDIGVLGPAETFTEGEPTDVRQTGPERDPGARRACLAHYGVACVICGFDFGHKYGSDAHGLIHVHHLYPFSEFGPRQTNPVQDLRPVCPNCHLVIHSRSPCIAVEDMQARIHRTK